VVDLRPFDVDVPPFPGRWGLPGSAAFGLYSPLLVSVSEDLAIVELDRSVEKVYKVAAGPPAPGDELWWVAYDFQGRKHAFDQVVMSGRVVGVVAGSVVLDEYSPEGSSGSCVLNSRGELVAVLAWGARVGVTDEVAVAVGVWGDALARLLKPKPAEKPDVEKKGRARP
jgi:hypothetical protein